MVTLGYFFGGSEFSFNIRFGVFGLFTHHNFVSVTYIAIMLGLYLMLTYILVSQIFTETIIRAAEPF